MADNNTNIPNNEEKSWYEKISWNYVLGGLLLLFALMYFSQNGCNKSYSGDYFEKQMDALKDQQQAIKNEYKLRQERKKIDDYLERYSDCDDSGIKTEKTCDKCHKAGCDGGEKCTGNSGYVDKRVGSPDININIGTTTTKSADSGTKKSSGGSYKKPTPKTETSPKQDSPRPDVKSDTNWKNCIIRIWNPDRTKCKDFPYTKAGRKEALSFIQAHNLNYDSLPSEESLPD